MATATVPDVKRFEDFKTDLFQAQCTNFPEKESVFQARRKKILTRVEKEVEGSIMSLLMSLYDSPVSVPRTYLATGLEADISHIPFQMFIERNGLRNNLVVERTEEDALTEIGLISSYPWFQFKRFARHHCFSLNIKLAILYYLEKVALKNKIEIRDYSQFSIQDRIRENIDKILSGLPSLKEPVLLTTHTAFMIGPGNDRTTQIALENYEGKVLLLKYSFVPIYKEWEKTEGLETDWEKTKRGLPELATADDIFEENKYLPVNDQDAHGEIAIAQKLDNLLAQYGLLA